MKIYNLEAFIICLCVLALAVVMLIIERGDVAIWVGIITAVLGLYVKSPIDWGKSGTSGNDISPGGTD